MIEQTETEAIQCPDCRAWFQDDRDGFWATSLYERHREHPHCSQCGHVEASHTEAGYLNPARRAGCWFRGLNENPPPRPCPCPGFVPIEQGALW